MHPARHPIPPYATNAYLSRFGSDSPPGYPAGIDPRLKLLSGYQPRQRRGAWPAIVCGNRRPDSRPLQSATIARPEGHLLNYPAGRGNWWRITESNRALPEASGLQPDGFAASLTLRKRCAWYSARRLANSTSGRPILVQPRVLVLPKMPSQPILWPSAFTAAAPSI